MNKVEPLINLTPALLARLKALQALHTEAATFSKSTKMISEEQGKITEDLQNLGGASRQVSFYGIFAGRMDFLKTRYDFCAKLVTSCLKNWILNTDTNDFFCRHVI